MVSLNKMSASSPPDELPVAPACSLYHLVAQRAEGDPTAVALLAPGQAPLSYAALLAQVDTMVAVLHASGLSRADRIALVLPNGVGAAVAFLAATAVATGVPLSASYQKGEYDAYFDALRVTDLVVAAGAGSQARAAALRRGLPVFELAGLGLLPTTGWDRPAGKEAPATLADAGPDGVAVVMLTSGTTARPKVVPLTHGNLLFSASATAAALALAPSDRCLSLAPLVHIHGLTVVLASLTAGASVVCPPEISALRFFEWLDDCAPTWYVASPAVHQAILGQAAAYREVITRRPLRLIRSGSAPLPAAVLQDLERSFEAPVLEAYGMTEAAPLISCNPLPPLPRKLNSVGLAAGPRVAIMDDAGALLPTGQVGEVVIQGPNVMAGYQDESANRAAFFSHGWFRTGDQGYLDEEGYLFLTGRLKELINRGGQKIAPREVDEALLRHPAVAEAVAFAAPHPTLGQEVAAAVVLRPGAQATEGELRAFVATHLSEPKIPRHILTRDALPRAAGGKLRRVGLAEELGLGLPPPAAGPVRPGDALERRMASLWEMALGVRSVGLHDDFFDLGGSSLLATILVAQIATAFGWRLPLGALRDHGTVAGLSELLRQRQQGFIEPALVPLQPDGPWPPFFCVPAMDGRVAYYRLLARHLAPDQPVYGLQGRAVPAGTTPEQDVGELAAHYVREIRAVQPNGPYYLGGYSAGGWLAYEMARQLHRQGQTVAFLALFDTPCPTLPFEGRLFMRPGRRAGRAGGARGPHPAWSRATAQAGSGPAAADHPAGGRPGWSARRDGSSAASADGRRGVPVVEPRGGEATPPGCSRAGRRRLRRPH